MLSELPRLTIYGSEAFEAQTWLALEDFARACAQVLSPRDYLALLLIGGYGRGEGGVEWREGCECLHNDLDFVLITRPGAVLRSQALVTRLQAPLQALEQRLGVETEISVLSDVKLRWMPPLLLLYEMVQGSRLLLGSEAEFSRLKSLKRFQVQKIPAWDLRDLLINRASLLLLNEYLLLCTPAQTALTEHKQRLLVRHVMKAIVGYGDAWLYFHGAYHGSYVQRQHQLMAHSELSPRFQQLYLEASEFRFRPDYAPYLDLARDYLAWLAELKPELEAVHLACEARRLRAPHLAELGWSAYPDLAVAGLSAEQRSALYAFKTGLKSLRSLGREYTEAKQAGTDWPVHLRWLVRAGELKRLFHLLLPYLLYRPEAPAYGPLVAALLQTEDEHSAVLRAYVQAWGQLGDLNFRRDILA